MATKVNGSGLSKNDFLKGTYNRKVRISYDRLLLILKDNVNKLSSINNFVEYIVGISVSFIGTIVTVVATDFSSEYAWVKVLCIMLCIAAALYYVIFFIWFLCKRITPEDIICKVEENNELDEDNHIKKKHSKTLI